MKDHSDPLRDDLLERVVHSDNMKAAWKQVVRNKQTHTQATGLLDQALHAMLDLAAMEASENAGQETA